MRLLLCLVLALLLVDAVTVADVDISGMRSVRMKSMIIMTDTSLEQEQLMITHILFCYSISRISLM